MIKPVYIAIIVVIVLGVIVLIASAFTVNETEQVIITQFGRPVRKPITTPGLHFKVPFIQKANFFDKRFLEWDGDPNQVPTKDKRFIWVDSYARWKITDPLRFFQRVRDERGAQSRLDDILDGETRNAIARHNLVELIRSTNREPQSAYELDSGEEKEIFPVIKSGRAQIEESIIKASSGKIRQYGIELLDLRFKRINYVKEVQAKIYERMKSERKRIAEKYRSEGNGEASKILGEKERELKRIQSEAYRTAEEIMGAADAEAVAVYAQAYNQNDLSRDFYRFLKTMETYVNTFSKNDSLILSTEGDFFKYMKKQSGK